MYGTARRPARRRNQYSPRVALARDAIRRSAPSADAVSRREGREENDTLPDLQAHVQECIVSREHWIRLLGSAFIAAPRPSVQLGCCSSGEGPWKSCFCNRGAAPTCASSGGTADFMRRREPLKQILIDTRDYWDHPETRPAVRENFIRMINCRTAALGAEIFASANEEKLVYHTCKSRACPSCGHRATLLWHREQWVALPDIRYAGIALTMPDALWSIFQQNRHLLHDLPALGAAVIQQWAKVKFGASVLIMVIPHTFGARLNFNSHLHILVSAGGLNDSGEGWTARLYFDRKKLMHMWRFAVITFLREALKAGVLTSNLHPGNLKAVLAREYRWWSTHVNYFQSKEHFLRYAGRYARRPPIAQHRFEEITDTTVRFSLKDKRLRMRVSAEYSPADFVALLAEHVPDRYRHAVRYFGLLAPRSKRRTATAILLFLGQQKRSRPRRLSWAYSIRRDFGYDPLIDSHGQPMRWAGRLSPRP